MSYTILMSAVSALAIGNAIFFGLHLFFSRKKSYPNKLLALLLFALALRISKSVIIIAFPYSSEIFPAIGLIGMAAIGPFVYLYIKSLFGVGYQRAVLLHFIPSLVIALTIAFVSEAVIYRYYQLVVTQIFIYVLISSLYIRKNLYELRTNRLKKEWCIRLLIGVMAIWGAFFYQLIADSLLSYVIATAIAVMVLYVLGYWSMQRRKVFSFNTLNGSESEVLKNVALQIEAIFKERKIYMEEDITLPKLSKETKYPSYLISKAINEVFHQTFPEFVNHFRVEEAKEKLAKDKKMALSIESIAFDSGFSTLSAFYSSFKKNVKMTPAEYRKKTIA